MTLKGNEEYCFEEILLKEFWSTPMILDPYEKFEKEKLEEKVEIIVAQTNVEKLVRLPMKELDSQCNQVHRVKNMKSRLWRLTHYN